MLNTDLTLLGQSTACKPHPDYKNSQLGLPLLLLLLLLLLRLLLLLLQESRPGKYSIGWHCLQQQPLFVPVAACCHVCRFCFVSRQCCTIDISRFATLLVLLLLLLLLLQESRPGKYIAGDSLSLGDLAIFNNLSMMRSGLMAGALASRHSFAHWLILTDYMMLSPAWVTLRC
jgi:hypothetical protein